MLPAERKKQGGRPAKYNRTMLNAMLWIARIGAPWRDLPEYYDSWKAYILGFAAGKCRACGIRFLDMFQLNPTSKM
ncbi:transposase [Paenibacillus sp. UY79]|nr:transposase [Paenibacillus farraposensis]